MGHCLFMRKGETHTAPVSYKANFADNTWEQIIDACQKNAVPDTWLVGDQKNMTINGTSYAIDIIGKNHDDYADGSGKAPLTFQIHDCYGTRYPMNYSSSNEGGWKDCSMRVTHLPSILSLIPEGIQNSIKEVNKLTSAGNKSSSINTTADKLFLLSEIEVFGSANYSYSGEGTQYAYYAAGNTTMKICPDGFQSWWERSPYTELNHYCTVYPEGNSYYYNSDSSRGISFAFCF